jgi:hypothetical protein
MPADTCARAETRVLAIYNLSGRLRSAPTLMHSLADWFDILRGFVSPTTGRRCACGG